MRRVTSTSLKNETCIAYGFPELEAMTSSGFVVDQVDKHIGIPVRAAARDVPASASSWTSRWAAAGANPSGKDTWRWALDTHHKAGYGVYPVQTLVLNISVVVSTSSTSQRTRGRSLYRSNACSLSRKLDIVSDENRHLGQKGSPDHIPGAFVEVVCNS